MNASSAADGLEDKRVLVVGASGHGTGAATAAAIKRLGGEVILAALAESASETSNAARRLPTPGHSAVLIASVAQRPRAVLRQGVSTRSIPETVAATNTQLCAAAHILSSVAGHERRPPKFRFGPISSRSSIRAIAAPWIAGWKRARATVHALIGGQSSAG
jgi:hypothetical protein